MTAKVEFAGVQLTPVQIRTLEAVASAKTLVAAAQEAEVHRTTLTGWMAQPEFREALASVYAARFDAIHTEAARLATKAFATLESVMDDPTSPAWLRARVAADVLNVALRIHEQAGLSHKLDVIDLRLEALNGGNQ
jgi:hypothetical protein